MSEQEKDVFLVELRKKFIASISHILRMSLPFFQKSSGQFRLMGVDFMLDTNGNLWFIEANTTPQLVQVLKYRHQFMLQMLRDTFQIQYAYFHSRMKRIRIFVQDAIKEYKDKGEEWDKVALKEKFKIANMDLMDEEFEIKTQNSWKKIVDMSGGKKEEEGYMGNLDSSCFCH